MLINVSPFADVQAAIDHACDAIDQAVGRERLRYLTEVPGQQATYDAKYADALEWLAEYNANAMPPEPGTYPWITAEALYTSATELDTAIGIAATGEIWRNQIGPELEGIRVGLKKAARAATTQREAVEQREAALDVIPGILG